MTDTAKYIVEALKELELVKSEASLMGWDDAWCSTYEYLALSEQEARKLEDARHRKLAWLFGVGAG